MSIIYDKISNRIRELQKEIEGRRNRIIKERLATGMSIKDISIDDNGIDVRTFREMLMGFRIGLKEVDDIIDELENQGKLIRRNGKVILVGGE